MYALSTGQIFIQWRVLSYLRTINQSVTAQFSDLTGSSPVSPLSTVFCFQKNPNIVTTLEKIFRSTANSSSRNPFGHIMTTEYIIIKCLDINPLHPNISLHILLTVLYTFPEMLTRRICLIIKRFLSR